MPLDAVEPLDVSDEDGDEAPLELDGLLALELGELVLPLLELEGDELVALGFDDLLPELESLEEPLEAEPELSFTPKAARVFWSSRPVAWIPLDCWYSFTAAWVFGPTLPSAGPVSIPAALSFS